MEVQGVSRNMDRTAVWVVVVREGFLVEESEYRVSQIEGVDGGREEWRREGTEKGEGESGHLRYSTGPSPLWQKKANVL